MEPGELEVVTVVISLDRKVNVSQARLDSLGPCSPDGMIRVDTHAPNAQ